MATSLRWIGGGNDRASNPNDWLPSQVPASGDILSVVPDATYPGPFTMNVRGNDLAGNQLFVSGSEIPLIATFNLSGHATLNALIEGGARSDVTVNIQGNDTATFNAPLSEAGPHLTVNLQNGATWTGTFHLIDTIFAVNGGGNGSKFNNDGASFLHRSGTATIGADVVGTGSIVLSEAGLQFTNSVGSGQTADEEGFAAVQIDQPNEFQAALTWGNFGGASAVRENEVDLLGLAKADSYSYQNDLLKFWSGNKVIDTLRFITPSPNDFVVQAPNAAGTIAILSTDLPHNLPSLPIHVGT
jgi:hypothetical protein